MISGPTPSVKPLNVMITSLLFFSVLLARRTLASETQRYFFLGMRGPWRAAEGLPVPADGGLRSRAALSVAF